jgi:hypothetical protein
MDAQGTAGDTAGTRRCTLSRRDCLATPLLLLPGIAPRTAPAQAAGGAQRISEEAARAVA